MNTLKFKTNLKCAGCMYAIKPYMDNLKGIKSWEVDLESPDRIVQVVTDTASADEIKGAIEKAIGEAGYSAESIN